MKSRLINLITIHCSDSDIAEHDDINVIKRWHIARGWRTVGYHWFIDKKGGLYSGRAEHEVGAHAKGFNQNSIGICLSGSQDFRKIQYEIAAQLCLDIMDRYNLEIKDIVAHNELDKSKTCPNFPISEITSRIYGPTGHGT